MRNLFIILALLITGSTYAAAFGENDPSIYAGCQNMGVNTKFDFKDMLAVMKGFGSGNGSNGSTATNPSDPAGNGSSDDDEVSPE